MERPSSVVVSTEIIHGEHVVLRPYRAGFSEAELQRMHGWSRDKELLRWSGGSVLLLSFPEFRKAFKRELNRRDKHSQSFALLTDTGEFIGRLGYYHIDYHRREAELGIAIGERDYWGRGYGTDAVRTIVAHIFRTTQLDRIYLHTYADNERAQRAFQNAGFHKAGQRHKFTLERGSHEEVEMEIYRDEWEAMQATRQSGSREDDPPRSQ
jgi:RimJ/RimL family protein N-acetyltransferase